MSSNANIYGFGTEGVNIVKSPLHLGDKEATQLQNAELVKDEAVGGEGALNKRGGLAALNGSALAGSVLGLIGLPLQTTYTRELYASLGTEDSHTWAKSSDGTTWTEVSTPLLAAVRTKIGGGMSDALLVDRAVSYKTLLIYGGNDYTIGSSYPPLVVWDGTNAIELARIPYGPSSDAGEPFRVTDMLKADGKIFLAVAESPGTGSNSQGRVLNLDLATGELGQVANAFGGGGSHEITGGFPQCLTWYQGQLWVGLNNGGSGTTGKVVRCYPEIDTTWTSDVSNLVGHPLSMVEFKGDLYAGTYSGAVGTAARIYKRAASTGSWSSVYSGQEAGSAQLQPGIVYNDTLYFVEFHSAATDIVHIKKSTDGSSWSTDRDVDSVDGVDGTSPQRPGNAVVFDSKLFIVFRASGIAAADGYILENNSGTWTKRSTKNFNGLLNVLVQRS